MGKVAAVLERVAIHGGSSPVDGRRSPGRHGIIQGGRIGWILEHRITKETLPFVGFEGRQLTSGGGDGGEPVVVNKVELSGDASSVGIQEKGNCGGMIWGEAEVDVTCGARLPARNLLAIRNPLVQHIARAAPDHEIVELGVRPTLTGEEIFWREAAVHFGKVVVEKHRMIHSHGPQLSISNLWPMDGGVKQHGAGARHDILDGFLCNPVVVVASSASKGGNLFELGQVLREFFAGEAGVLINSVSLGNDSMVTASKLKLLLGL